MTKKSQADYVVSSGNIFKDLGLPNPELENIKAQLAFEIFKIIKHRKLTQSEIGQILGVGQPEISKLKNGLYHRFSLERLFNFLNLLHYNVDIKLSIARGSQPHQRVIGEN